MLGARHEFHLFEIWAMSTSIGMLGDGTIMPCDEKLESEIDELALYTFDIYAKCREQLYDLKTDELKRMTFTLLKKANLMSEIPVEEFEHRNRD